MSILAKVSFTSWGRIKWDEVTYHRSIDYAEDIDEWLVENKIDNKTVILLWAYGDYPAVKPA